MSSYIRGPTFASDSDDTVDPFSYVPLSESVASKAPKSPAVKSNRKPSLVAKECKSSVQSKDKAIPGNTKKKVDIGGMGCGLKLSPKKFKHPVVKLQADFKTVSGSVGKNKVVSGGVSKNKTVSGGVGIKA